jgi:hypothetical protein
MNSLQICKRRESQGKEGFEVRTENAELRRLGDPGWRLTFTNLRKAEPPGGGAE